MFDAFLGRLFGSRNPNELVRERMRAWQDWLQALPSESAGNGSGAGRDPGYEDAFFLVKEEVGKLSRIDDDLIVRSCERLLKEVGKDVRLAAYYAFARLRRDGCAGFADGIELMAALVDRFDEALLPARPEVRKVALEWLASSRLLEQLSVHEDFAPADLERAMAALNLLVNRTAQWAESARPDLQPLVTRFAQDEVALPPVMPTASSNVTPLTAAPLAPAVAAVGSSRDLLEQARIMAQFLRNQELGYLSSTRLIRCVRWDIVHDLPPCDQQARTRLLAPRAELRQQLKRLALQKQWHELLERVEGAFSEGANHLWFDLQYFQHAALEQIGTPYTGWRDLLRTDFALMLERLSGIERLAFSDGTPFADDTTLDWIARYTVVRDLEAGEAPAPLAVSGEGTGADLDYWQEMEAQARDVLSGEGLEAAFAWLQRLPDVQSERQQFLQRWLMARLADRAGKPETAVYLLTQLDSLAQSLQLLRWEPALVFDIKHHLLRALKQSASRKDADKPSLARRVEQLQAELTVLNPAQALALI